MLVALAHAVVLSPDVIGKGSADGSISKTLPKGEALQDLLAEAESIIKQVIGTVEQNLPAM